MLKAAEREVQEIGQLVLRPTPANFQAIQSKLEILAGLLSRAMADPAALSADAREFRHFCEQLPAEMSRIQALMAAPAMFYQRLETIRALHFGSYERSGAVRSLDFKPSTRTVMHL